MPDTIEITAGDVAPVPALATVTCDHCGATHEVRLPDEVPEDARDVRFECHAPLFTGGEPLLVDGVPQQCGQVTVLMVRSRPDAEPGTDGPVAVSAGDAAGAESAASLG